VIPAAPLKSVTTVPGMKTEALDEMTDAEVLAMALNDMEFLGLIEWKPDADKNSHADKMGTGGLEPSIP